MKRSNLEFKRRLFKRLIDVLGSCCIIVILSPILLIVAILVGLIEGRPILYRRRVMGGSGEFDALKFRTMRKDADAVLAADPELKAAFVENFKLKLDPRVTRLGAWLRKYSLDELPQLFNVLVGQMSLVGPRMITVPELEKYGPHKSMLLSVKPGITGYWQISGRQDVSYEERVRMDFYYISNWTPGLDISILLMTPVKVICGKGAY